MRPSTLFFVFAVSVFSIGLNILLQRTAGRSGDFLTAVFSVDFAVAFAVGTVTALLMLMVYLTQIDLARAILLMGALSILVGTLVGVIFYHNQLDPVEWGLFGLIAVLYAYRSYLAVTT